MAASPRPTAALPRAPWKPWSVSTRTSSAGWASTRAAAIAPPTFTSTPAARERGGTDSSEGRVAREEGRACGLVPLCVSGHPCSPPAIFAEAGPVVPRSSPLVPAHMNPNLRDRILRKLESLSDERAYQVLDYVEFIESKYAERQNPPPNVFQRFAETVEDRLRAGRVSAATISEAMGLMNRAVSVLNGVAAAGKSVANDIVTAARPATPPTTGAPPVGSPVSTP